MVGLIDECIAGIHGRPEGPKSIHEGIEERPKTRLVLPAMLQAMGSSSGTLIRLSDEPGLQSRDCFSICRSIVELGVNICYILAEGDSAASRALRHSNQKAVRDLKRESRVGPQTIRMAASGLEDLDLPDEVEASLDEFTSRSGREKGWVDLSIDDRCARIGELLGEEVLTPLHWARFAVYRHSSEILHGTFFGAAFFLGLTDPSGPPENPGDMVERIASQHLMVLLAAVLSIEAVVSAMHVVFDDPEMLARSNDGLARLREAPFFQNSADGSEGD